MKNLANKKGGFTIVEVLVSVGIMLIFLPFAASMLTNSQLLASYSKHKIQAAYAAEQLIETQRQSTFQVIPPGQSVTLGPAALVLDTKGNYNNSNCNNPGIFCGTEVMTITPAVYTNASGVKTTSTTTNHFVVKIYWSERIFTAFVPITETYAEDIINDPMLN